ncbi:LOW QUALITY PROTEIN: midasin-like [Trichogramma pretiosum]|uniref:LOW QUALITY PROTEIN: midasin-like n=1 Tax=Trichogramma pretiosum TaxID=7493 RepID=UPI000C71AC3F|nr:LOW QUALITY PROTEIN: midasin-like [Trichogramma pretiosum]
MLENLGIFCARREVYKQNFNNILKLKTLTPEIETEILDSLCTFLMNPEYSKDVAECFSQSLLSLLTMSTTRDQSHNYDGDPLHRINCVIIGKLILIHPDVLIFALDYFNKYPAPFEKLSKGTNEPRKIKRQMSQSRPRKVSDSEIVEATYNILLAFPEYFKYKFHWSKFYKYLGHDDIKLKWTAIKCVAIVLEMSESQRNNCIKALINNADQFQFLSDDQENVKSMFDVKQTLSEPEQFENHCSSVVSVAGVLLPIFNKDMTKSVNDLVPVQSMKENLRSLAIAVVSRKCICLQGPVGCGKTAIIEYLAEITGHGPSDFIKVQLGDQTDSKMLLGTYKCSDIPGEFTWQPGVLTQAVIDGKWLLLEDIDSAALDVASILGNLMETGTLSVPGYRDTIYAKSGFQLFFTQRLVPTSSGFQKKSCNAVRLLEKHWFVVNMEPLSQEELITVVKTLFPVLSTCAKKIVEVFLLFSMGNHEIDKSGDNNLKTIFKTGRLISTRDLKKWCLRASADFEVSSNESALKLLQDAIDIFCCSLTTQAQRLKVAVAIANKLGIIEYQAKYFILTHAANLTPSPNVFLFGRGKINKKETSLLAINQSIPRYSFTKPSARLIERIATSIAQREPVLLVGETGTGKNSSIQYIAQSTGHKLLVINMNQQSESSDLLGGYRPVDLRVLIIPIRQEFEDLFRSYFATEPNQKFLSHIETCFEKAQWNNLVILMKHSTDAALRRLKNTINGSANNHGMITETKCDPSHTTLMKWLKLSSKLDKLLSQVNSKHSIALSFIEGCLVKALKEGYWILLDEINLANADTLECLSGLLEGACGSLSLLERGDREPIKRHPDFTIFACMNPATDVGKKELPVGLRNRFTEFYVDELEESSDLLLLVNDYLNELHLPINKHTAIVKFYQSVRSEATHYLFDGTAHKPVYSLRTLCRALSVAAANPCITVLRSLYEALCLSFLTQLDHKSYPIVKKMIDDAILDKKSAKAVVAVPIPKPQSISGEKYLNIEGYWIVQGSNEPELLPSQNYVLTPSVLRNFKDVVRVVSIGKMPLLIQGDTSVGKTSLITYLARATGHVCLRINNHEHTDLQEYVGSYVADKSGRLIFQEGILIKAMRKGYWIILDELNLAPSDVLEALNRLLDDNRELFISETQETVKAHENFMLFATQNPPGHYGGRKVLSRAFRNRFVELHFDEIPTTELQTILHQRCAIPESYCKQIIAVMQELQVKRKNTATFAGKRGFITLRDLFRWAERYRQAPHVTGLYDWNQHLADEGYLVLAAKVRKSEEAQEIREIIKKHLKRDVNPDDLFTLHEKTSFVTRSILEEIEKTKTASFKNVVWTYHMRRMAVLVRKAYQFKEPVLLVGETGGGKTTVCQIIAHMSGRKLYTVNCHMHTESSDFLGNLRPVRGHNDDDRLFDWVDGPLVQAMQSGNFFLADEISLADDGVLERLNSLLEPERSLLLAEKGISFDCTNESENFIVANDKFFFLGTMNPGGDYGKKELSPALRNRFTEIWCDGCHDRQDLKAIMAHNLSEKIEDKDNLTDCILNFAEWLATTDVGKKFSVSIRDLLTWTKFVNACVEKERGKRKLTLKDAYFHGACLTFIDSLGSGMNNMLSVKTLKTFENNAFDFIKLQIDKLVESTSETSVDIDSAETNHDGLYGISPFYIERGELSSEESITSFTFQAPTTQQNCTKLLRALQLSKPILLEGSPGVGKTSLVSALAQASGHSCLRINLSDQTDISDLFGADLPVEGGKAGEFSWKDGPFLRALKAGQWILLEEMNLASQSVLEGLNACFDHRGQIYIPELGKTFNVRSETKLFACQNPLRQGGGRRGLPKSFLNRFTQIFVDALSNDDLKFIASSQYPKIDSMIVEKMTEFNLRMAREAGVNWGIYGAPWEMNLRDICRWCEATIETAYINTEGSVVCNPGNAVELIYVDRMRTRQDKDKAKQIYEEIFDINVYPLLPPVTVHMSEEKVYFGSIAVERTDSSYCTDSNFLLLRNQMSTLQSLALCVKMNWVSILVGSSGSGKSSVVRVLAQMAGQKLKSIVVNSDMDNSEILGGFEQTDYNRHLEYLIEQTETLLIKHLKTKVQKENIGQIEKYHSLIEHVRSFLDDECKLLTTSAATEQFIRRIDGLSMLLAEMKREKLLLTEIRAIRVQLRQLKSCVEEDQCLNAGGKFEWVDSVLVKCLKEGTWLLIDQVNLCSPAVLDRLNGLLEPNGVLSIGERGIGSDGNIVTVKPHENFRLFFAMDPKHGEISRAMRNRGVEIFLLPNQESPDTVDLDYRSLLHQTGLTKRNHQEALMMLHKRMCEDISNCDNLNVIQLLHTAFLVVQQLRRAFPVVQAFESSCKDVYIRARSIFDHETRLRLIAIIVDTICEYEVGTASDYVFDMNVATCNLDSLYENSKLSIIKHHGFLLDWCVREYLRVSKEHPESLVNLKTEFFNNFFSYDVESTSTGLMEIVPYILLNFYEYSTMADVEQRKKWASSLFERCSGMKYFGIKSEILATDVSRYELDSNLDINLPWDNKLFKRANNMALILFFDMLIADHDTRANLTIKESDEFITVAQFSEATRMGETTFQLHDQLLISKYGTILHQFKRCINGMIKSTKTVLDNTKYVLLRQKLQSYRRFCNLGDKNLMKKTDLMNISDVNMDEIALLLKVHFKWLKKCVFFLNEIYEDRSSNPKYKKDFKQLKESIHQVEKESATVYDPFRKVCKLYKKQIVSSLACSFNTALNVYSQLKYVTESFSPSKNKYFSGPLSEESKFITLQTEEALKIRSELIHLWHKFYINEEFEEDVLEKLFKIGHYCDEHFNISTFSDDKLSSVLKTNSSKDLIKWTAKIQLWPIHEYMLNLYIGMVQTQLFKKFISEENDYSLPFFNLSDHEIELSNVPTELLAILKAIQTKKDLPEERNRLIFALSIWFTKFSENSYATKYYKEITHWQAKCTELQIKSPVEREEMSLENPVSGPVLINLVTEILLNKNQIDHRSHGSLNFEANLGRYQACLHQLQTVNDMLWANSVSINSQRFDFIANDVETLRLLVSNFLSASEQIDTDTLFKKHLKSDKSGSKPIIEDEYLKPLEELRKISKTLEQDTSNPVRGKAWTLLGFLQTFVFGNIGYIDPVYKVMIKLGYVDDEISDSKSTLYVAKLYSKILGLADSAKHHPRLVEIERNLQTLKIEKESLQSRQSVRPSNSEFTALSKEFSNFRQSLGSFSVIDKHIKQLSETISQLEFQGDLKFLDNAKSTNRAAEIWLASLRGFMNKVEEQFLLGYPDMVYPVITGLARIHHGIRILIEESNRLISASETNLGAEKLESLLCNLVRFPTFGSSQENFLELVNLCTSRESRELVLFSVMPDNKLLAVREQFRLTMSGLYEIQNYIVLKGTLTKKTWVELNELLNQIVATWRQQKAETEKHEDENIMAEISDEEEQIDRELKILFPTYRDDLADIDETFTPALEKSVSPNKENNYVTLLTDTDIQKVHEIHSNIVNFYITSEWLMRKSSQLAVHYEKPLLQRYSTFAIISNKISPALSNNLTENLYTSINLLASFARRLNRGEVLNPLNNVKSSKPYDYYRDSNVKEIENCIPLLENITNKVSDLLNEWSQHSTLKSIKVVLEKIYSFPVTSAVSKFLTGFELLLVKMHEWEENAPHDASLSEFIFALIRQIKELRKLELACWKDCLVATETKLQENASKNWFFLYSLTDSYIKKEKLKGEEEPITSVKLIKSLELFMKESPLVEFKARLQLLMTFHHHAYFAKTCTERDELLAITWNVHNYYSQFSLGIQKRLNAVKAPIENKLEAFLNIARWNDKSYWEVKEKVKETHRTLYKYIKEYETNLKDPVTPYLIVKPISEGDEGTFDRLYLHDNDHITSVDPKEFTVSIPAHSFNAPTVQSDLITRAENHYLTRATKLCEKIISSSSYYSLRMEFEEFIKEKVGSSIELRELKIGKRVPLSVKKRKAKSILQRKKSALSDYFEDIKSFGVSNVNVNSESEGLDFTIPPLELEAALKNTLEFGKLDEKTINQWIGCEKYYYGSLSKLNALIQSLSTNATDLGVNNIELCKGFSAHLMLLANEQKKNLATVLKYFISLRSQINDLTFINPDDNTATKQKDIRNSANNLRELLITIRASLDQLLVYLHACPEQSNSRDVSSIYTLSSHELPFEECKKGDATWKKASSYITECSDIVSSLAEEFNKLFPEMYILCGENNEMEDQVNIINSRHFGFLKNSFESLKTVRDKIIEFSNMFITNDGSYHPLLNNIKFLEDSIGDKIKEFDNLVTALNKPLESEDTWSTDSLDQYEIELEKLVNMILIVIQNKYKNIVGAISEKNGDNANSKVDGKLRDKLIKSIEIDIKALKLKDIHQSLNSLLKTTFNVDQRSILSYTRLLQKCLPLFQQYLLLAQFYINEQTASLRLTCKILHLQLNVFLDLANNGFCIPDDLDLTSSDEGEQEKENENGMNLGDGEGQRDVSDQVENENQLEEATLVGQEGKKLDDEDSTEKNEGIERSENVEEKSQDVNKKDDDKEEDEASDLDKQTDEIEDVTDKLDEQIWGEDEEKLEEIGNGEQSNTESQQDSHGQSEEIEASERDQQQGINEMKEPQYDEDQVNPSHGQMEAPTEPEGLNLPENINIDETEMRDDEPMNEENPFDLDKMRGDMVSHEPDIFETTEEVVDYEVESEKYYSGDDKHDPEKSSDNFDNHEVITIDEDQNMTDAEVTPSSQKVEKEEENGEPESKNKDEDENQEDKSLPHSGEAAQGLPEGSLRDTISKESIDNLEFNSESNSENWQDVKDILNNHTLTDQADAEKKRKNMSESDEDYELTESNEPKQKKIKNIVNARNESAEDVIGVSESDCYEVDNAVEKLLKEKVSNIEREERSSKKQHEEAMDVDVYEDEKIEPMDDDFSVKDNLEKVDNEKKANDSQLETPAEVDIQGEVTETTKVSRGDEVNFFINNITFEPETISSEQIESRRVEVEKTLSQWVQKPSTAEALAAWNDVSAVTHIGACDLAEKLRLVLEPSQATSLKGDYRTGRRINMRKIIPYIASQFRKDKIWLRRTKPFKRNYQIVLAIDDSSSMVDNHSKVLAYESVSLISKALTHLEAGELSIISFGEETNILHQLGDTFTEHSGARLMQEMRFEQKQTLIAKMLDFTVDMFESHSSSLDNAKLLVIISDGRGVFSDGIQRIKCAIRRARLADIFLVFIIVDSPMNKESIFDIKMPVFKDGRLAAMNPYMDSFPFPFYMILKDINTLPEVLSDALRQWFEIVGINHS